MKPHCTNWSQQWYLAHVTLLQPANLIITPVTIAPVHHILTMNALPPIPDAVVAPVTVALKNTTIARTSTILTTTTTSPTNTTAVALAMTLTLLYPRTLLPRLPLVFQTADLFVFL
jgi:hypothetical protein